MLTRPRLRSGNASMIKTTGSFLGTVIVRFRRSHVFWALFLSRFSGFPDLLRDAQPGTAKGALGYREGFGRQPYFYTSIAHTCDKINTALFLWPMIWVLGHRSEGTDTGLGSFRPFRAAEGNLTVSTAGKSAQERSEWDDRFMRRVWLRLSSSSRAEADRVFGYCDR